MSPDRRGQKEGRGYSLLRKKNGEEESKKKNLYQGEAVASDQTISEEGARESVLSRGRLRKGKKLISSSRTFWIRSRKKVLSG